jgi:hypothetical protein
LAFAAWISSQLPAAEVGQVWNALNANRGRCVAGSNLYPVPAVAIAADAA